MATANVIGVPMCPDQDSVYITHIDNFTSIWYFDIFFNLNHLSPLQGYFVN